MTMIVFCRMDDKSALSTYYCALAVSDLVFLCFEVFPFWIWFQFDINIFASSDVTCKLVSSLSFIGFTSSAWYLVAMTTQRAVAVVWPHRVIVICTRKVSFVVTAVIAVVVILSYSHILYGLSVYTSRWGNSSSSVSYICMPSGSDYQNFFATFFPWLDIFLASLGPFVFLFVSNFILVKALIASVKRARHRLAVGQSTHVTAREKKACSLSVRLIVLSVTFFVLTAPLRLFLFLFFKQKVFKLNMTVGASSFMLSCLELMSSSNAVINVYLYCLTAAKFRAEIRRMFMFCRKSYVK